MRTSTWAGAGLLCAALLAGCGGGDVTGVGYEPLVGVWTAVAYNNGPLPIRQPVMIGTTPCVVETTSMRIEFTAQGRYISEHQSTAECGSSPPVDASQQLQGTYRVSGSTLFLRASGQAEGATPFTLDGNTLVLTEHVDGQPIPLEFRRGMD